MGFKQPLRDQQNRDFDCLFCGRSTVDLRFPFFFSSFPVFFLLYIPSFFPYFPLTPNLASRHIPTGLAKGVGYYRFQGGGGGRRLVEHYGGAANACPLFPEKISYVYGGGVVFSSPFFLFPTTTTTTKKNLSIFGFPITKVQRAYRGGKGRGAGLPPPPPLNKKFHCVSRGRLRMYVCMCVCMCTYCFFLQVVVKVV